MTMKSSEVAFSQKQFNCENNVRILMILKKGVHEIKNLFGRVSKKKIQIRQNKLLN